MKATGQLFLLARDHSCMCVVPSRRAEGHLEASGSTGGCCGVDHSLLTPVLFAPAAMERRNCLLEQRKVTREL